MDAEQPRQQRKTGMGKAMAMEIADQPAISTDFDLRRYAMEPECQLGFIRE